MTRPLLMHQKLFVGILSFVLGVFPLGSQAQYYYDYYDDFLFYETYTPTAQEIYDNTNALYQSGFIDYDLYLVEYDSYVEAYYQEVDPRISSVSSTSTWNPEAPGTSTPNVATEDGTYYLEYKVEATFTENSLTYDVAETYTGGGQLSSSITITYKPAPEPEPEPTPPPPEPEPEPTPPPEPEPEPKKGPPPQSKKSESPPPSSAPGPVGPPASTPFYAPVNQPPTAAISCIPANCIGYTGDVFTLNNNSTDPDGSQDIAESRWDILGWGSNPDLLCPPNAPNLCDYTVPTQTLGAGNHQARLRVQDTQGAWDQTNPFGFTIKQDAVAVFDCSFNGSVWQDCSTLSPAVGQLVYFKSTSTPSEDATSITSYSWTFEGGNPASSTQENPTAVFQGTGSRSVSLMVVDNVGRQDTKEVNVTISIPFPDFIEISPF